MIGICIKYYHENYGGMLQAFATTKILEKRNISYEIVRYKKEKNLKLIIKSIPRIFNNVLINDKYEAIQKKVSLKVHPKLKKNNEIRMEAFKRFREKNFKKLSEINYGYINLCKNSKKYEAVLTGSDQLWSPAGLPTNFYNLMFVDKDIKKISYASSFGVKDIPWYQKKRTAEFLNRMDFISMRENSGKKIVKELTGKDVPVVLDPVFLLNKEEWDTLIENKNIYNEKYIFAYFLGNNIEYRKNVEKFAKLLNLKIVTLRHLDQYIEYDEHFGDYAPYDVEPSDFLNLIRNAEYIFTDSFHGSVFSIIYNKQFLVFNRYSDKSKHSKNSRITTLCENLGINNCRFSGDVTQIIDKPIIYDGIPEKIQYLKRQSEKYLDDALR